MNLVVGNLVVRRVNLFQGYLFDNVFNPFGYNVYHRRPCIKHVFSELVYTVSHVCDSGKRLHVRGAIRVIRCALGAISGAVFGRSGDPQSFLARCSDVGGDLLTIPVGKVTSSQAQKCTSRLPVEVLYVKNRNQNGQ